MRQSLLLSRSGWFRGELRTEGAGESGWHVDGTRFICLKEKML
jgi:hypothetical protein